MGSIEKTAKTRRAPRSPLSLVSSGFLARDEGRRLGFEMAAGDETATERLVVSHLALARAVARRYARPGLSNEDLVSEGVLGLMEAARRFDPEKGASFGAYASWWVRAKVRCFAISNRRIVPVPSTRNMRRILWSLGAARNRISQRQGRSATRDEVASELGVPSDDLAMLESALSGRDLAIGPRDAGPDVDPASQLPGPEEVLANVELFARRRASLRKAILSLSDREQEIIRQRHLIEDRTTLAELGVHFGVSRERVRQIEMRAEHKLHQTLLRDPALCEATTETG